MGRVQQLDPFLDVGLIGALVPLDVAEKAVRRGGPLGRLAVEEGGDLNVELAHVHRVDAILKPAIVRPQAGDRLIVEGLLAGVAFAQCSRNPVEDLLWSQRGPPSKSDFAAATHLTQSSSCLLTAGPAHTNLREPRVFTFCSYIFGFGPTFALYLDVEEVQHDDYIDCSTCVVPTRRWEVGIISLRLLAI